MTTITNVNRGTTPGDGTGDTAYDAFGKVNTNDNNLNTDKLERDGSIPLTANWDVGSFSLTMASLNTDTINEETAAAGVTVDGVLIKDGAIGWAYIGDVTASAAEVNLLDLSGLTAGWALIADTATTASWQAITLSDISDAGTAITLDYVTGNGDTTTNNVNASSIFAGDPGLTSDGQFFMGALSATVPQLQFDVGDRIQYDRGSNQFEFEISNVDQMVLNGSSVDFQNNDVKTTGDFYSSVNNSSVTYGGGDTGFAGANIVLQGGASGSAYDILFRSDTTIEMEFDYSLNGGTFDFRANHITTTGTITGNTITSNGDLTIQDASSADLVLNDTGGDGADTISARLLFQSNSVERGTIGWSTSTGNFGINNLTTGDNYYNIATGAVHRFRINSVEEFTLNASTADFNANDITTTGNITAANTTLQTSTGGPTLVLYDTDTALSDGETSAQITFKTNDTSNPNSDAARIYTKGFGSTGTVDLAFQTGTAGAITDTLLLEASGTANFTNDVLASRYNVKGKRNRIYSNWSNSSQILSGDWWEVLEITPTSNSSNHALIGDITFQNVENLTTVQFQLAVRGNTLPNLTTTLRYCVIHGDEESGDGTWDLVYWYNSTTGTIKLLLKNISAGTIQNCNAMFKALLRSNYSADLIVTTAATEYTGGPAAGYAETSGTRMLYFDENEKLFLPGSLDVPNNATVDGNITGAGNIFAGNNTLTVDNQFYMGASSADTPAIFFATGGSNDYIDFIRSTNTFRWQIAGTTAMTLKASLLNLVDGDITTTGNITSAGLDDLHSGTGTAQLQISSNDAAYLRLYNAVDDGGITITGGNDENSGGGITFYGGNAGSVTRDILFVADSIEVGRWDDSLGAWDFASNDIRTGGDLLFDVNKAGIDWSNSQTATAATGATTTSEVLDHYEEGTWTPVLTDLTNDATSAAGTDGTYTRIGRVVFFSGRLVTSSLGSVSGSLYIKGLPFSHHSFANEEGGVYATYGAGLSITASMGISGRIVNGTDYIRLVLWDATTGSSNMQSSEWTADGQLYFAGQYYIAT